MSNSYLGVRFFDGYENPNYPNETKVQRRARMQGVYDRAVPAAEEAEHSHKIPEHKASTLSYTYA